MKFNWQQQRITSNFNNYIYIDIIIFICLFNHNHIRAISLFYSVSLERVDLEGKTERKRYFFFHLKLIKCRKKLPTAWSAGPEVRIHSSEMKNPDPVRTESQIRIQFFEEFVPGPVFPNSQIQILFFQSVRPGSSFSESLNRIQFFRRVRFGSSSSLKSRMRSEDPDLDPKFQ